MKVTARADVRYFDESGTVPSGLSISTELKIEQAPKGYGTRDGTADIPMTFVEKAQSELRKTVIAALETAAKAGS